MSDTDEQGLFDSEDVIFLTVEQVIELHDGLIARFSPSESCNILNYGMLNSAVMTPQQSFGDQYIYDTIEKKAAA